MINEKDTPIDYRQFEGHTPGPWEEDDGHIFKDGSIAKIYDYYEKAGDGFNVDVVRTRGNKNLIKAAPDLLKENQSLKLELQKQKEEFSDVRNNFHQINKQLMDDLVKQKELNAELVIGQETQALNLVRLGDLLDRCYHHITQHPPNIKKMSYNEWESILEELNYYRSESLIKKSPEI